MYAPCSNLPPACRTVKATSAAVYTCADLFLVLRCAGADLRRVLEGWVPWQRSHVGAAADHQDYYLYHFGDHEQFAEMAQKAGINLDAGLVTPYFVLSKTRLLKEGAASA